MTRLHSATVGSRTTAAERSLVARSWGGSRGGDVLQVTAVKEKPRRHNRRPRWNRDSLRNRRGPCPRGAHGAAPRDLPHGLTANRLLSQPSPCSPGPPAVRVAGRLLGITSDAPSMPLRAHDRVNAEPMLRKLHTSAACKKVIRPRADEIQGNPRTQRAVARRGGRLMARLHSATVGSRTTAAERSLVARPWGGSRGEDTLQPRRHRPRRHNREPRWNRDSLRNRREPCPRGVHSAAPRDLPHGLTANRLLSPLLTGPPAVRIADLGSNALNMPLRARDRVNVEPMLPQLHTTAAQRSPAA